MSRFGRTRVGGLLALLAVSGAGGSQAWGQDDRSAVLVGDGRVSESSALAVSPRDADLLHTVNDSGHDPVVYTVDRTSGDVVGTTLLAGLDPDTLDPEALAVAAGGRLWVADTGDNLRQRSDVALYALPAPGRGETGVRPLRFPIRYDGGPRDVEALLVDPRRGTGWLVTKGLLGGRVLRLPEPMRPGDPGDVVVPEQVRGLRVPGLVTDGTVLPGLPGRRGAPAAAVVRTYVDAHVYRLPQWTPVGSFGLPRQEQGESITALPDGRTLLAGSEGSPARIDEVPVPGRILRALSRSPSETSGAESGGAATAEEGTTDDGTALRTALTWLTAGAGALLVVAVPLLFLRARRSRAT